MKTQEFFSETGFTFTEKSIYNFAKFGYEMRRVARSAALDILILVYRFWMSKTEVKLTDYNYAFSILVAEGKKVTIGAIEALVTKIKKGEIEDGISSVLLFSYFDKEPSEEWVKLNEKFIHTIDLFDAVKLNEEQGSWIMFKTPVDNVWLPGIVAGHDGEITNIITITPQFTALTYHLWLKGSTYEKATYEDLVDTFGEEVIKALKESYQKMVEHRNDRFDRVKTKVEKAAEKAAAEAEKVAARTEALNKKLKLINSAKNLQELKDAYNKARKTSTFGSIGKAGMLKLNKAKKELEEKFNEAKKKAAEVARIKKEAEEDAKAKKEAAEVAKAKKEAEAKKAEGTKAAAIQAKAEKKVKELAKKATPKPEKATK
jgi:predicted ribosome quality control (RQC) complex YloA/Tae2 family protein